MIDYKKWIDNFMNAWKDKNVEGVMKTISKDCKYFETVFDEPCSNIDEIKKLWEVVPKNQKDIEYDYEIILEDKNFCIVNFTIKRTLVPAGVIQDIDGVFQISLDENGQCSFFKQWRSVKE